VDRVALVPVILRGWQGYFDARCFDADRNCADPCARAFAKESRDGLQNRWRVASCSVYGPVGLSQLKGIAMLTFDTWIQKKHPELLTEFKKLPKAKKAQTFYDWAKEHHPGVILREWPAAAKIRARHLRSETERE